MTTAENAARLKIAQHRFKHATMIVAGLATMDFGYQEGYGRTSAVIWGSQSEIAKLVDEARHVSPKLKRMTRIDYPDGDYIIFAVIGGVQCPPYGPCSDLLCVCEPDADEPAIGFLCNVSFLHTAKDYDAILKRLKEEVK